MRLDTKLHDRDAAGFRHVYPVVSRRARGVSIGVNLNPNHACNWRCVYCQVPGLSRGSAPEIDLALLESELRAFLEDVVRGDYMERHVPADARRLNDVAFSGDGESTTSPQFRDVIDTVASVLGDYDLEGVKLVLITNGSLVHKAWVQEGLERMARRGGEVWFKLDSATKEGRQRLNDATISDERVAENLATCAALCPTRIQTMWLAFDGAGPSETEQAAYVAFLSRALQQGVPLVDVMLYGLERASHQPEAPRLAQLPVAELEAFAQRIAALGLAVHVHP